MKKSSKKSSKIGERGDSITRQHGNLTVTAWQDNQVVTVMSTMCDPTKTASVTRTLKNNTEISVPCPLAIKNYNLFMGGVDYNDQLRKYYHFRLKSRKFYKYIFWFLVELCIVNAYIMCKDHTHLTKLDLKEFRSKLATELIGSYCSRKRRGRPSSAPPPKRFSVVEHWPTRGAERSHRCHYCQTHLSRRRESVWKCQQCNVFLCHNGKEDDCFFNYHYNHINQH